MKGIFTTLCVVTAILSQSINAQRRGQSSRTNFTPISEAQAENTVNFLGIELGQTLAQVKKSIEAQGGEVVWLGSADSNFVRTKEYLKNGQASYFRYAAHSIRNIAPKITSSLASKSYSREDIVINLDVYPKAAGDLKDPDNLTVYRINTYLGYQPSPLQLRHPNINPVQVSYADFHALMENKGHILYQSGAFLVYKKEKGHSIDIGDLKAARSTWKKMQPKTSPCNKLSTLADDFPKKVYDMINGLRSRSENGGNAIIHYKPWSEIIDTYAGQGTFQSYTECGNATVVQPILTKNPNNPDNPLLHHVSMHYQNAALLDNVFKGFYNAIYKE